MEPKGKSSMQYALEHRQQNALDAEKSRTAKMISDQRREHSDLAMKRLDFVAITALTTCIPIAGIVVLDAIKELLS